MYTAGRETGPLMEYNDCEDVVEDYVRRSAVYKSIFNVLDLDNWLYERDGHFERIRMSGLTSVEKISDVQ